MRVVIAAALFSAVATSSTWAQSIQGEITISGSVQRTGGTGLTWDPDQDNLVEAATGDFAPFVGEQPIFSDLMFDPFSPVDPLFTVTDTESGDVLSFAVTSLVVVEERSLRLQLEAQGTFSLTGFSDTPGWFSFDAFAAGAKSAYRLIARDGLPSPPDIDLEPTSIDFGAVQPVDAVLHTVDLVIHNLGEAALLITSISRCPGTSTEFTWVAVEPPIPILGGSTGGATIWYVADDVGKDTGCLEIASTDPDEGLVQLPVSGQYGLPFEGTVEILGQTALGGFVPTGGTSVSDLSDATGLEFRAEREMGIGTATGDFDSVSGAIIVSDFVFDPLPSLVESMLVLGPSTRAVWFDLESVEIEVRNSGRLVLSGLGHFEAPAWADTPATFSFTSGEYFAGEGVWAFTIEVSTISFQEIHLDPSAIDFGPGAVGGSRSIDVRVRNLGGLDLDVGPIALCDGTSSEFSWSPEGLFTVGPADSQVLTVTYEPNAEGADAGCLSIASNDSDEDPIELAVAGKGVGCTMSHRVISGVIDQAEEIVACNSITVAPDTDLVRATLVAGHSVVFEGDAVVRNLVVVVDPDFLP